MECRCITVLGFPTMNLHGICVIQFVGGRYDAVDYVQDLSADIVYGTLQVLDYWYLVVEMENS